jgi:hypothetical protein
MGLSVDCQQIERKSREPGSFIAFFTPGKDVAANPGVERAYTDDIA